MKSNFFLLMLLLFFYSCYTNDEEGFSYIQIEVENALVVDNQGNYMVGDTLFVNLNFSRYLQEDGYTNLLDIYKSTAAERFSYSLDLEKFSTISNDYIRTPIAPENIYAVTGELQNEYGEVVAVLNENRDIYSSRIGIVLKESGNYRLNFQYVTIRPEYKPDKIFLEIIPRFPNTLEEDFIFTVAE
ncbi:hypothetical protein [Maribacter sp. 4G9]|jgi:hypothetical protein|uniref:hypothetical protein n=1 Tax=Maribacter sp. 4G9 TaxID=1889777 RepID=UPI000C145302|nr:hypothetical protein [Maribacter sp. 4G9]PIB31492.1 hypothetical protein BFP75_20815 [Maribacter sp. 4G9]